MHPKMLAATAAEFLDVSIQYIHKQIKSKELEHDKTKNRIFFGYKTALELFEIDFQKKIISFEIVKGGTGKSTILHSLACCATLYGARVLCVDLDPQGNLTTAFSVDADNGPVMVDVIEQEHEITDCIVPIFDGLDLIPSRIENVTLDNKIMLKGLPLDRVYSEKLRPLLSDYDFILIDCPPTIGHSVSGATLSSDIVIAPLNPDKFSLKGLTIIDQELKNLSKSFRNVPPIKILLNKFDGRTLLSNKIVADLMGDDLIRNRMLNAIVRINQEFPNVIDKNISIFDSVALSVAKDDIHLLTREILGISNNREPKEGKEVKEVKYATTA